MLNASKDFEKDMMIHTCF